MLLALREAKKMLKTTVKALKIKFYLEKAKLILKNSQNKFESYDTMKMYKY
jgi:hypothetical protein